MQHAAATASSLRAPTDLLKKVSQPFRARTSFSVFFSLLLFFLAAPFAYGESLDANGIRMTYPDGYARPELSKIRPHAYTYSSFRKISPSGVIAVITRITDGKLSPESKQQIIAGDRLALLEKLLDAQLSLFEQSISRPDAMVSTSPVEVVSLSGESGARKMLVQSRPTLTNKAVLYNALVNFKLVEFQILVTGSVSQEDIDEIMAAVEHATLDSKVIGALDID